MPTFVLFFSLFGNPDLILLSAKEAAHKEDYDASLSLLKLINRRRIGNTSEFQYYLAISAYSTNNRKLAQSACEYILSDFSDVPKRYLAVAQLMLEDMEQWKEKDSGELDDIGRRMRNIGNRLASSKAGRETRELQKKVLDDLDKLIKKAEDEKNKKNTNEPDGQEKRKSDGDGDGQSQPKADSDIASDAGKGEIDSKKIREIAQVWGKLPEKEQVKATIELTRNLPAKYRDVVRDYIINVGAKSGVNSRR